MYEEDKDYKERTANSPNRNNYGMDPNTQMIGREEIHNGSYDNNPDQGKLYQSPSVPKTSLDTDVQADNERRTIFGNTEADRAYIRNDYKRDNSYGYGNERSAERDNYSIYHSADTNYRQNREYENGNGYNRYYPNSSNLAYAGTEKKKKVLLPAILAVFGILLIAAILVIGISVLNKSQTGGKGVVSQVTKEHKNTADINNTADVEVKNNAVAPTLAKTDSGNVNQASSTSGSYTVTDVSAIVEEILPSVVAVTNTLEYRNYYSREVEEGAASGSGVIISQNDDEILIVTNNHVVDENGEYYYYSTSSLGYTVEFKDGSTAEAYVKGASSENDLAILAVKTDSLSEDARASIKISTIGNSDALKLGEGVIAIGNALGYGQSVTTGVVSALNRDLSGAITEIPCIQTDAAINHGNSGGGLFNMKGELIGINVAKLSANNAEGMGFAIPITQGETIINTLLSGSETSKAPEEQGFLGISGADVTSAISRAYNAPVGVLVTSISEGFAAANAGIAQNDIITKINDTKISSFHELKRVLSGYSGGDEVTIVYERSENGEYKEYSTKAVLNKKGEYSGAGK